MDLETNAEIHRLVEAITKDNLTKTFNAADARRLIDLVPITPHKGFSFSYSRRGGSFSGFSPGVGNVKIDDGDKKKLEITPEKEIRAGGHKLRHSPGRLVIDHLWIDTQQDQTGYSCRLDYQVADKRPERLSLLKQRGIYIPTGIRQLWPLQIEWESAVNVGTYESWKKPDFNDDNFNLQRD